MLLIMYATALATKKSGDFQGLQVKFGVCVGPFLGTPLPGTLLTEWIDERGRRGFQSSNHSSGILVRRFCVGAVWEFSRPLGNDDEPLHDSLLWMRPAARGNVSRYWERGEQMIPGIICSSRKDCLGTPLRTCRYFWNIDVIRFLQPIRMMYNTSHRL
jgi:hypothetical protein